MKRFNPLLISVLSLWLVGSMVMAQKPNIILYVADDHGKDALGCYGNSVIQTPNLDALAADGVKFDNAYCTSASCAASRSVILTGKFGHAIGAYGHTHAYHHFSAFEGTPSLPLILEENGYHTARIGKYHLAPESVYHFDEVISFKPARNTVVMSEKTKKVLASEDPFFLYICSHDPHRSAPFYSEQWDDPNHFGNKDGDAEYKGVSKKVYSPDEVFVPDFLPDNATTRREIAEYYQSVSRVDQGFGRLMDMLKASGKYDNTIVMYISDNGMAFPGAKTSVYEPGLQLPCIIKGVNNTNKGITNTATVSWADLTPTLLDMVDVKFEKDDFDGRSFAGIYNKTKAKGWDTYYASHTFHEITMYYPMRVVRHGDYKLIWNIAWRLEYPFASDLWASSTWQSVYRVDGKDFGGRTTQNFLFRAEFELYNLKEDAGEVHNLANDEAYAKVLKDLKTELRDFQTKTSDPWVIMWDHDISLQDNKSSL